MAEIPIKSITFSDLPNNKYVIPQVDATLATAGDAADAKATGDQLTELRSAINDVTETIVGKNIIDVSPLMSKSGVTYSDGVFSGTATNLSIQLMTDAFEAGKQYTVSVYGYTDGNSSTSGNGITIGFKYTDDSLSRDYFPNSTSNYIRKSVVSNSEKTIKCIVLAYASSGSNTWHLKDFQLEVGDEASPYAPPKSEESAIDIVARDKIASWYSDFVREPMRIAYSNIWIDVRNTVSHWLLASDMGFNVLKGDAEITSDGELVMCHDPGFTFDSNGRIVAYDSSNNTKIVDMTLEECRSKVYAENPSRFGDYCPVADIDDFLRVCKDKGKICFITIRITNTEDVVNKLADKIISYGMETRTIINALSTSILNVVRANAKCDKIAINYIASQGVAITNADVDKCVSLGRCFLSVWCNDNMTVLDNSATAIAYARTKGVPILAGCVRAMGSWNYLMENGVLGSQVDKPIFDVEPKNYRFKVTLSSGDATFGNLFANDRFSGTVSVSNGKIYVSNIYITDSLYTNVIDGLQPVKMNLLNPEIRCLDGNGNDVNCVWANNALVITPSNLNDAVYTILVTV